MEGLHFDLSEKLTSIPTVVAFSENQEKRFTLKEFAQLTGATYEWFVDSMDGVSDNGLVQTDIDQGNGFNWTFTKRGNYKVKIIMTWTDPLTGEVKNESFDFSFFVNKFLSVTEIKFVSNDIQKEGE
jgi:hypothetical protein